MPSLPNRLLLSGVLENEATTVALGKALIRLASPGDVFFLDGPLGAGKTTLARAMIKELLPQECREIDVPSPTFTLVQVYETSSMPIWHFDLYRVEEEGEVLELGWEDALIDAVSLIEWPDRLGRLQPPDRLNVALDFDGASRRVRLTGYGNWCERVSEYEEAGLAQALISKGTR